MHDDVIQWKHFPRNWPLCGEVSVCKMAAISSRPQCVNEMAPCPSGARAWFHAVIPRLHAHTIKITHVRLTLGHLTQQKLTFREMFSVHNTRFVVKSFLHRAWYYYLLTLLKISQRLLNKNSGNLTLRCVSEGTICCNNPELLFRAFHSFLQWDLITDYAMVR